MELARGQMDLDLALIKLIAARFTDHYRPILPIANNLLTVRAITTDSLFGSSVHFVRDVSDARIGA